MSKENANDLFIKASRKKLTFQTRKGTIQTEDLWDLSLESLDEIAVALDGVVNNRKKSFIGKRDMTRSEDELRFSIVTFVIETKIAEAEAKKLRQQTQEEVARLESLLLRRKEESFAAQSEEAILARLNELRAASAA